MLFFENAYLGTPTWDIGHPQPAIVRLTDEGECEGDVLDLGCGTGENALFLASRGIRVIGVDFVPAAIDRARAKARERELGAEFHLGDAFELARLGRTFDTVLDVGLFHTLQPETRGEYAESVRTVLRPRGRLFVLAWSDRNPFGRGPERIARSQFARSFREGWTTERIEEETLETLLPEGTIFAWLARLVRT